LDTSEKINAKLTASIQSSSDFQISTDKFERITIRRKSTTDDFEVILCVSYYESREGLTTATEDRYMDAWSGRPTSVDKMRSGCHNDLVSLMLAARQLAANPKELSMAKISTDKNPDGDVVAVWNFLKFNVENNRIPGLLQLIRTYFETYPGDLELKIYAE
jgi:hypothetical protein